MRPPFELTSSWIRTSSNSPSPRSRSMSPLIVSSLNRSPDLVWIWALIVSVAMRLFPTTRISLTTWPLATVTDSTFAFCSTLCDLQLQQSNEMQAKHHTAVFIIVTQAVRICTDNHTRMAVVYVTPADCLAKSHAGLPVSARLSTVSLSAKKACRTPPYTPMA